jgi:CheY-like chemotaxis protein
MDDAGRVLVVDNDRAIASVVQSVLADAGFGVIVLTDVSSTALRALVDACAPDCVLLDGQGAGLYGTSWTDAAWLHDHWPPVQTIMFTADQPSADEALDRISSRSRRAAFAAVLTKPFDIDDLIRVVADAIKLRAPA